jgi:hypothetical protein
VFEINDIEVVVISVMNTSREPMLWFHHDYLLLNDTSNNTPSFTITHLHQIYPCRQPTHIFAIITFLQDTLLQKLANYTVYSIGLFVFDTIYVEYISGGTGINIKLICVKLFFNTCNPTSRVSASHPR